MTEEDARETMDEPEVIEVPAEVEPDEESPLFKWFVQQAEVYHRIARQGV